MRRYWFACVGLSCGAVACVFWLAVGASRAQQAKPQPIPLQPLVEKEPAAEPGPIAVPDGTPEELLKFIDQVAEQELPQGIGEEEAKAEIARRLKAMVEAGGKVLAAKPTEEQALRAIRAKLSGLAGLGQLGDADAARQLEGFPAEITAAGFPEHSRGVAAVLLQRNLAGAMKSGDAEVEQVVEQIGKFLAEGPVGRGDVNLAMQTAMMLEQTGKQEMAVEAYASFGKALKASDDEAVAGLGEKMEGAARRIGLLGSAMQIEGKKLGGEPLDWATFVKDKAVLVMFWATWCGPCKAELPNVQALYEAYHDKGFDVVAISCDDSRETLEQFVKDRQLPWPILFSDDPEATGMENPMASKFGVLGIPTMILVGTDGKVLSLNARGPILRKELEKIFGPAEKKPDAEASESKG